MQPTAPPEGPSPMAAPPPTEVVSPPVTGAFGAPAEVTPPPQMPPLPDGHIIQGAPYAGMPPSPDPSIYASKDAAGAEARASAWGAPTGLTTDGAMAPGSEPGPVLTPSPIVTEPQPTPEHTGVPSGMPSAEPVQPDLSAIPSTPPAEAPIPAPLPTTPQEAMTQTAIPAPAAETSPTVDMSTIKETATDQEVLKAAADASSAIKLVEEEELRRGVGDAFAVRLAYIWGVPKDGSDKVH